MNIYALTNGGQVNSEGDEWPEDERFNGDNDLIDWTIENLNITNVSFDEKSTSMVLVEPTQKVKTYINNLNFRVVFKSKFRINPEVIDYQEESIVEVNVANISVSILKKFKVVEIKDKGKEDTTTDTEYLNKLMLDIDSIQVSAKGQKDMNLTYNGQGIFVY